MGIHVLPRSFSTGASTERTRTSTDRSLPSFVAEGELERSRAAWCGGHEQPTRQRHDRRLQNAEPYLAEAIDSVLAQNYRPLELIVVDDGSDDGSGDVARGYGDALTYIRQERQGNGAARNSAVVGVARGDLFAFLDADDRFTPTSWSCMMAALEADPEFDVVFGT